MPILPSVRSHRFAICGAGVRWAEEAGFSKEQVDEFRQLLSLVENVFIDHDAIKDSKKIAGQLLLTRSM